MSPRPHRAVRPSVARRALVVSVSIVGLAAPVLFAAPATAAFESGIEANPRLPPQGMYEGCAPEAAGDACAKRLVAIRAAGFRYVLNYSSWYGSPAAVLRYADTAAALGLQLIWPLNDPAWLGQDSLSSTYSGFGEHAHLSNPEFTSLAIDLVASHSATWGFYIGDEVAPSEASLVGALSASVRRLAPDEPQLYVARPGAERLEPFAPFADVAGVDAYPVGSGDPPVGQAARGARTVTAAAGAQTAMVLQAFSWSQYLPDSHLPRYPNSHSLQAMRDAAIRHANPAMILWYSYQDILRSDRPHQRWSELTRAAFSPGPAR